MSIETTYKQLITEEYLRDRLSRGISVSAQDVVDELAAEFESMDLNVPQFNADMHKVERKENASASSFKNTFLTIRQDVRVLYKELINLAQVNSRAFERWDLESNNLEKRLIDLEERIDNLLLLTQDTEGYHSVIIDNFTDTSLVDLDASNIELDLMSATVEMSTSVGEGVDERIFLNNLNEVNDVTFKVRTTVDQISRVDAVNSSLTNIFHQESKNWWTSINMKSQKPVTCELLVKLTNGEPIEISRIFMQLHDSSESSPVYITPLYSIDNRTFNQLPTNTYTLEAKTTAVFSFSTIEAKWIKFVLTKRGPDPSSGVDFFSYQFGFKSIQFFKRGFVVDVANTLITEPLYALNPQGEVQEFEKLVLETCERLETGTTINYFITASNDPDVPLDNDLNPQGGPWIPISPIQRATRVHPVIMDVGDILEITIGDTELDDSDTEIVTISYDGRSTNPDFVNPDADFKLLSRDPGTGNVIQGDRSASSSPRYAFQNSNDRLLNYQIKYTDNGVSGSALNIDLDNLMVFRNIGAKGFELNDVNNLVRNVQRGWRYEEPYYICVIEIQNPNGMTIDVGDNNIIIDDVSYSNIIDNTILTGKSGIPGDSGRDSGVHSIKVHKNNWREVTPNLNTLTELKAADPLYPYNHKMLIEGYAYGDSYPETEEKLYTGVDLFAGYVMQRISPFDLINNIPANRYDVFALDLDAPKSHDAPNDDNNPTRVFLLKIDESNPDFQNERFVIRFNLINELRKYLRLRADLYTENANIGPALHAYKIKLG